MSTIARATLKFISSLTLVNKLDEAATVLAALSAAIEAGEPEPRLASPLERTRG
jgi:hypothetical protein